MKKYSFAAIFIFILISCNFPDEESVNYNYGTDETDTNYTVINEPVHWSESFDLGRKATPGEIKAWDIDVRPDGKGLPDGSGDAATGKIIYEIKCASCHGKNGTGGTQSRLVAIMGDTTKAKAIGNYWPYATTLFDYVRRAMPYNAPGSLKDAEVYSLSAYLLYLNKIIDSETVMNKHQLPKIKMPAQPFFVNDDRKSGPAVR